MSEFQRRYMTVKEAAGYLGCHPCTIYRWIDEGILQAYQVLCPPGKPAKGTRRKFLRRTQIENLLFAVPAKAS